MPNLSKKRLFRFLLFLTIFRLIYASIIPITSDEALHWLWSKHPALSYPEHPPLVAYLIYLFTNVFGDNVFGVRFIFVLMTFFVSILIYDISVLVFKDDRVGFFNAFVFNILPITQFGILAKTDIIFMFFYLLTLYAVLIDDFYLLSFSLGAAFLSKLLAPFLILSIFIYFILKKEKFYKRKEFIPAVLIFLILISPVLIWNFKNNFFEIKMRFGHQTASGLTYKYFLELFSSQFLTYSPFIFPLLICAFFKVLKDKNFEVMSFSFPIIFFFFLFSLKARVGVHWPSFAFTVLFLKLGEMFVKTKRKWFYNFSVFFSTVITILIWIIPLVPEIVPKNIYYKERKEWLNTNRLNEIWGWDELGKEVKKYYDNIENPKFLLVSRWGLATLISFYTKETNTFTIYEPTRNGRSFYLWEDKFRFLGKDAIIVFDYKDKKIKTEKLFKDWFEKLDYIETFKIKGRIYYIYRGRKFKKVRIHI